MTAITCVPGPPMHSFSGPNASPPLVSPCALATLKMVSPFATTWWRWAGGAAAAATEATAAGLARPRRGPSSREGREVREAGPGRGAEGLSGPRGPASARARAAASGCSIRGPAKPAGRICGLL